METYGGKFRLVRKGAKESWSVWGIVDCRYGCRRPGEGEKWNEGDMGGRRTERKGTGCMKEECKR